MTALSPTLAWTEALHTGDARMDETHQEFIGMLNELMVTPAQDQLPLYRRFLLHTVEHFAQEERWMLATGFAADNCHASHHATILETMRAVETHVQAGDTEIIQRLAEALAEWFPGHAKTKDVGLTSYLQEIGFDTRAEQLTQPDAALNAHGGCGTNHACS